MINLSQRTEHFPQNAGTRCRGLRMPHLPEKSSPPSADRTPRDLFAWSLLASLILLGAMAGPFFAGRVYTRDDLGAYHLPIRAFYARQLAQGEPFDWMPQIYSGFYLTGEGQAGTYHPLHLVLYACLPLRAAVAWDWLIPYPAMLVGTWFFLRRRLKRRDAAMLGSLLFTFSGFNLLHFLHPNAIAVVAHIPWLLWAIDVVMLDGSRRKVTGAQAAIALLTGSQILLGYPQYVWFSLIAEAAYVIFLRLNDRWGRLVVAKGIGLLLGAVQLLPTIDALTQSTRHATEETVAFWNSLPPSNLVQLVAPYLLSDRVVGNNTHEAGLYAGAAPLMLIVWVLIRQDQLGSMKRLARSAAIFGLLAMFLAFGQYGKLYYLQTYLPVVGDFRCPCRYILLFHLAAAVMAAIGFVLLARDYQRACGERGGTPQSVPWRQHTSLWIVVGASVAAAGFGLLSGSESWTASTQAVLAGPLLLGTAATLVVLAARGFKAALVGLILFAAADLGVYGLSYAVYPQTFRLGQYVASAATPPAGVDGRVMTSPLPYNQRVRRTGNQMTLAGWHRADGYAGLEPQRNLDYRRLAALRSASVRWLKKSKAAGEIEGLWKHPGEWLEVPRPLPWVRLVSRARFSQDPARDIEQIDLETTALTNVPLALPDSPPGKATLVAERPGRLHIQCDCSTPQLLVVSESFHPGWQAIVDGSPQQVVRVNGDFIGCPVGPGQRQVVFEFRPRSLHRGRAVSCLGLAMVLICFAGGQVPPAGRPGEDKLP